MEEALVLGLQTDDPLNRRKAFLVMDSFASHRKGFPETVVLQCDD